MAALAFDPKLFLESLVAIESPSGDQDAIQRVVEHIATALPMDIAMVFRPTPMGPLLEASRGQGGALLLGHADTVWPQGTLETMPFLDHNGEVSGPGTLDMKGGLVLAVWAIRQLPADVPFTLLVTPDEEVGSEHSRDRIEFFARRASLVLVLESGMPGGAIKVARAGVGDFCLDVAGVESHAGLDPDHGASAIREFAQQVMWLQSLENRTLETTINVGTVMGGTRSNVVAGHVEAHVDVRVTTSRELERIRDTLAGPPTFDPRCQVHYRGGFNRPPMESDAGSLRWQESARNLWYRVTGQSLKGARVGGASDGNFTAALCPTLDGLGAVGGGAHARHEFLSWEYMEPRAKLIQGLIEEAAR